MLSPNFFASFGKIIGTALFVASGCPVLSFA
jgi:hypothetical protein